MSKRTTKQRRAARRGRGTATVRDPRVGRNLRRLRTERTLSLRAFCALVVPPVEPAQLLATELGKTEPTLRTIRRYATALGVPVSSLLEAP